MALSCVLVIEDSEPDRLLCQCAIEEYDPNIKILMASVGQQAIEVLETTDEKPFIEQAFHKIIASLD